jgi:hypothetical protein
VGRQEQCVAVVVAGHGSGVQAGQAWSTIPDVMLLHSTSARMDSLLEVVCCGAFGQLVKSTVGVDIALAPS